MNRGTIELNYSKTIQQADNLDGLASMARITAEQQINPCLQNVSARWKGENSSIYISKGSSIISETTRYASEINRVASVIREVARRIREAELEALRIEEERAYLAQLEEEKRIREKEKTSKGNKGGKNQY